MDVFFSDSDYESPTETSDSEDQNDTESSFGGRARSILSSLDESIGKVDNFLLFGRGFVHGDIVSSITDPSKQLGRVMDVQVFVDLEAPNGALIKNVDSKKLCRVRSFGSGDYVVHGPWLGIVQEAIDVATVLFNDGTKCEIVSGGAETLIPVSTGFYDEAPHSYYPGQCVLVEHPKASRSARWLCGPWKTRREEAIICHVDVGLVRVKWIASVMIGSNIFHPPHILSPKALTLLSCFPYANWQLGDWCYLQNAWLRYPHAALCASALQCSPPRCSTDEQSNIEGGDVCRRTFVISRTRTEVDVQWQNGEKSLGFDSQNLYPVNNIGDHDFWPEQLVLRKVISEDLQVLSNMQLAVVKQVDAREQTAKVKWIESELNFAEDVTVELNEETVSTYELMEHPDFNYCIGDVVFKVFPGAGNSQKCSFDGRTREDWPMDDHTSETNSVGDHNVEGFNCLSYVGNVVGWEGGAIEVKWASGFISKVHPSEIFGLDRLVDPSEEETTASLSKQTGEQDVMSSLVKENVKEVFDGSNHVCKKDAKDAGIPTFPIAAIHFLANVARSLFGCNVSDSLCGSELSVEVLQNNADGQAPKNSNYQEDMLNESPVFSTTVKDEVSFDKFNIVADYLDHHFVNCAGQSMVNKAWLKKLHQEWSILQTALPDGIYVEAYEERMDLLRAVIVGAHGTPYHDGLFFFDICLPPDYPHEPPIVHYHSGGLRLNPNLYESGKVCLSLLKTWTGTGTEVWSPETSSVLQVLVSLQALVLNEKPYFNEAGYDRQVGRAEGEKNSVAYNENAYILSLRSMLYIIRNPPKHFEAMVEDHFALRGQNILLSCKARMEGLAGLAEGGGGGRRSFCSTGFKIMLGRIYPKLVAAFMELGVDCDLGTAQLPCLE